MRTLLTILIALPLCAQVRSRSIRSFGDASVTTIPDQVSVSASVRTVAPTAQEAAAENAAAVSRLLEQLKAVVGAAGTVRTTSYSVAANFVQPAPNVPARQEGFAATNTITTTSPDISLAGRIIDTAAAAGATTVGNLSFGLRNSRPFVAEALKQAATRSREKAEAIASGLGLNLGIVLGMDERSATFNNLNSSVAPGGFATPIEPGLVTVTGSVGLEIEIR